MDASSWSAGRIRSFAYAFRGVAVLVRSQPNARIHTAATAAVAVAGVAFQVSALEWCALVLAAALVWTTEALNSALELLCDAVRPERDPLVGAAKDVAAAGVLLAAIGAAVVGLVVFVPHGLRLLARVVGAGDGG